MDRLSRRQFLATGGIATAVVAAGVTSSIIRPVADRASAAAAGPRTGSAAGAVPPAATRRLPGDVFRLGVASGDPLPRSVVLWTRLAPAPLHGGGMPDRVVTVEWEIAADQAFRRRVASGSALARPELAHSVHVEPGGLRPGTEYFYRFRASGQLSPVGRTRTAPAPGSDPGRLRFALASCQSYADGYYVAHRDIADQDLAFVAFLGDYLYESAPRDGGPRRHSGTDKPFDLAAYRNRYGQYRSDPDLAAAHAASPWIVALDDHEVENNWAGDVPGDPDRHTREQFLARRTAAFQAWYEHMPVRRSAVPAGTSMWVYRRLEFGSLATMHVLDTRQHRTRRAKTLAQANDPARTLTGEAQERWLADGLTTGEQRWNLVANQVMVAQSDGTAGPRQSFAFDTWDGYRAQRRRLMQLFGSGRVANPVVCSGDRHATWVCDLKDDFDDERSATVGAEIMTTSISSNGDPDEAGFHRRYDPIMAESPHWKYIDNRRGYVLCDLDRNRMLSTLRVARTVTDPANAELYDAARFVTEAGRPGVQLVD